MTSKIHFLTKRKIFFYNLGRTLLGQRLFGSFSSSFKKDRMVKEKGCFFKKTHCVFFSYAAKSK